MSKYYNCEQFVAIIDGRYIVFNAHSTNTRNGFCHTIECPTLDLTDTKVSYINRTWETFRYETVLRKAIDKCPKSMRAELTRQLIDKTEKEVTERCNKMVNAFKKMHDRLSEESKKKLADSNIQMQTESDVNAVMELMGIMALTEEKEA